MKRKRFIALNLLVVLMASAVAYYSALFYDAYQESKQALSELSEDVHFDKSAEDNTHEYRGSSNISLSDENFFVLDSDFITISPEVEGLINSVQFYSFLQQTLCKKPAPDFYLTHRSLII
ncbi:MAG: hypothetical protein EBR30_18965 [Cytophagia bacterium]|nr:hypothetical protein [Cytophagia bacterium]